MLCRYLVDNYNSIWILSSDVFIFYDVFVLCIDVVYGSLRFHSRPKSHGSFNWLKESLKKYIN